MRITPLDIQRQQFTIRFRGFDVSEVDAFLEQVANGLEELILENQALREELERTKAQVKEYQKREENLKETLMTAQKAVEEMKSAAKKEAQIVLSDAQLRAEKMLNKANQRVAKIMDDINQLKRQRLYFESNLRSLIENQLKMLEAWAVEEKEAPPVEEQLRFIKKED